MALICFASPKGGVGKTTLAANVASGLSRAGWTVIALDLDPQNSLRLHFGIALGDRNGFTHQLLQQSDWRASLRPTASGVALLAYGPTDMPNAMALAASVTHSPALLQGPISDMLANPQVCMVVDTPPGPSALLAALLPMTDLLLTVLQVDATSLSLIPAIESGVIYGAAGASREPARHTDQGFILNQFDPRTRLGSPIADAASRHLGTRLLGIVYRDEHVAEAVAAQKVLADYAPAAKATQDIGQVIRAIQFRLAQSQSKAPSQPGTMGQPANGWMVGSRA
jgi:cellulose synthase operon protein YhjQ